MFSSFANQIWIISPSKKLNTWYPLLRTFYPMRSVVVLGGTFFWFHDKM